MRECIALTVADVLIHTALDVRADRLLPMDHAVRDLLAHRLAIGGHGSKVANVVASMVHPVPACPVLLHCVTVLIRTLQNLGKILGELLQL